MSLRIEIYEGDRHVGTETVADDDYVVLTHGRAAVTGTEIFKGGDYHRISVQGRGTDRQRQGLPERRPFNG